MKKPIEQKSPLAAWATTARAEAGMSVEEVVDALAERGHAIRAATIRGIEGGSKGASARLRRLLGEIYDRPAPGQTNTAAPDDPVAAAIREQTVVLSALVEELRATRQERETVEARLRALEAGVALLTQATDAELPDPIAPRA